MNNIGSVHIDHKLGKNEGSENKKEKNRKKKDGKERKKIKTEKNNIRSAHRS